ncbi:hypothetical protein PIB30_015569 [Stylosanthes scabra]|uniref:Uncharacterized protein n=1 Tax=Stylosanthes scabra TaxID=79078 RepID=A0ABU6Q6Y6_9FABA|nr:hypothetical protein [Stylosanthes scabra]
MGAAPATSCDAISTTAESPWSCEGQVATFSGGASQKLVCERGGRRGFPSAVADGEGHAVGGAVDRGTRGGQCAPWLVAVVGDSGKKKEEAVVGVALGMGKGVRGVLSLFLNENERETWTPNLEVGLHYMLKAQREFLQC